MSEINRPAYYTVQELQILQNQGVILPSPSHLCIGREVPLENINAGAVLYPFCTITGERTRIYPDARVGLRGSVSIHNSVVGSKAVIGNLGPVTLVETVTGPETVLGMGVAENSVFLGKETQVDDFTTGMGFRARKGSLYEEDSSSAQHTDTKMTILFPWVTLGSNINFCDALIAGGRGPDMGEFTEVGSGTVHFNFTLRGDKATASLFGNVPEGAFLRSERLFLGGNNSLLGPLSAQFGAFSAAGIRSAGELKAGLNLGRGLPTGHTDYNPNVFNHARRIIGQQVHYVGQLTALYHWYREVRMRLVGNNAERRRLYEAGQNVVALNIQERIKQVGRYVEGLETSIRILNQKPLPPRKTITEQEILLEHWSRLERHLKNYENHVWELPGVLSNALEETAARKDSVYTKVIRNLPEESVKFGQDWLHSIVHRCEHFFLNELKPDE